MEPNLARGQYVMISRLAYWLRAPTRGDVVVARAPVQPSREFVKRIIGLPGEHVRIARGQVFIDGRPLEEPYLLNHGPKWGAPFQQWLLDEEEYFVMGDNRASSSDSRSFGPLKRDLILGKGWIRYWPRSAWGRVKHGPTLTGGR